MGRSLGFAVKTVRHPEMGSDYFGPCEVCGKHMSATEIHQTSTLFVDRDGDIYLSNSTAGVYAHTGCMLWEGARIVSKATLKKKGNMYIYPRFALVSDLVAAGISPYSAESIVEEKLAG